MTIAFTAGAWEEFESWLRDDPKQARKITALLRDVQRTPFAGLGKPEPLRHELAGYWSRRIDQEHRLVYGVGADTITVVQCRFHY